MTRRLAVPRALVALIAAALPSAAVLGPDDDAVAATRVDQDGNVTVETGDPGEPEIDLSPLSYNYSHKIGVELVAASEAALDAMLDAIGKMVVANRTLGGLVEWLDTSAPVTEDLGVVDGAMPPRVASLIVTALYATTTPI